MMMVELAGLLLLLGIVAASFGWLADAIGARLRSLV
jgi:hypothetical protein